MQQWKSGQSVSDFMLWTSIDGGTPCWHRMKAVKTLGKNRRDGYTHDAVIVGSKGVRGVRLTDDAYHEGCWLLIAEDTSPHTAALSPPHTSAPAYNRENPSSTVLRQSSNSRPKRNKLPFHCDQCNATREQFLFCPDSSPDGEVPPLKCQKCAPKEWRAISRTDYVRCQG